MVLPASSRLWFSRLEKVGQSWVLMTIFGRVLCPLQPSCLPPLHAARALLLSSFPLVVYPHFFCFLLLLLLLLHHHHQNRTRFNPLLVSLYAHCAPYRSIPFLLSPAHPVTELFCLFSPNPLLPLILLLPASPLFTSSFVLSLLITSCVPPFLPYPSPAGNCAHPGFSLAVHRELGPLAPGLFWLHPFVPNHLCSMTHVFANSLTYAHPHTCVPTLFMCQTVRVLICTPTPMCLLKHVHFHTHSICVS